MNTNEEEQIRVYSCALVVRCLSGDFLGLPRRRRGPSRANAIRRPRVLLRQRAVRRHRQPIEVVVEEPIPAGKVGVSVNAHQFVIVPVNIGHPLRLFSEVEAMKN